MVQKSALKKTSKKLLSGTEPVAAEVTAHGGAVYVFGLPDKNGFRLMTRASCTFEVKIVPPGELEKEPLEATVGYIEVDRPFYYMPRDDKYGLWYKSGPVAKIVPKSSDTND